MDNKIVLLDFCGTVTDYQTFNPYVEYVLDRSHIKYRGMTSCFLKLVDRVTSKIGVNLNVYKKFIIRKTKGLNASLMKDCAREYYEKTVSNHLIKETVELIKKLKNEGYVFVIVSAACDLYVSYFAKEYSIDHVVANEFLFRNEKSEGTLTQRDCIGRKKVCLLKEYTEKCGIKGEYMICITDSKTDSPIMNLCKKVYILSYNYHQKWVDSEMEEIIWH